MAAAVGFSTESFDKGGRKEGNGKHRKKTFCRNQYTKLKEVALLLWGREGGSGPSCDLSKL